MTRNRLMEVLSYNPDTGIFIRRKSGGGIKKGSVAGTIRPDGYRQIRIDGRLYRAHRLAWLYMYGVMPDVIDHDKRDTDDNRIKSLNNGTLSDNMHNMTIRKDNTSGITGVRFCRHRKKHVAMITINGKAINLGRYVDENEAVCARLHANKLYGFHANHGRNMNE